MLKLKKALLSAFFIVCQVAQPVWATCLPSGSFESVSISKVVDGDTVRLSSGRSVRLLGINTPELNIRSGQPEPYAQEAHQALKDLAHNADAQLVLGQDAQDHYKRLLGHLIFDQRSAAEVLLRQGLGWAVVIEPNTQQADCLFAAESEARAAGRGVWAEPLTRATQIDQGGFTLTRGRVTRIDATPKYIYLELDDHLALRLTRKHFSAAEIVSFGKSLGRVVEARGWVVDRRAKLKPGSRYKGFLLSIGSRWHLSLLTP